MKKLLGLLALAAGTACQPQASSRQTQVATGAPDSSSTPVGAAEATEPGVPSLLAKHNLTSLLQTVAGVEAAGKEHIYNGFFGPEHRRIELVFTNVQRDPARPNVYHIQGKDRYRGLITPFSGTLEFTQVVEQPRYTKKEIAALRAGEVDYAGDDYYTEENKHQLYTTAGIFKLREDSTHKNSGVFRGVVALDLYPDPKNGLDLVSRTDRTLARGSKAKFEGTWTRYGTATSTSKPVVWVEDIFAYGEHVFNNFTVGMRDIDFNPKYAKLGWNTYWANDEWWTPGYRDTARSAPLRRVLFTPPVVRADDSTVAN